MELIVALATIAQRYRLLIDSSDRHSMAARLTMTPKYGLKVLLKERELSSRSIQ